MRKRSAGGGIRPRIDRAAEFPRPVPGYHPAPSRREVPMRRLLAAVLLAAGCSSGEAPAPVTPPKGETMKAPAAQETVILAGGCFWGMEEILRKIPGVVSTEVGYSNGN